MEVAKHDAAAITAKILAAVDGILAEHGMVRGKTRSKYGDLYAINIEAGHVTLGVNGINESSQEARAYKALHRAYGLPDGLLGKKFSVNGRDYAFAGIASSRRKYPIYVKNLLTGDMSFFEESVKRFLVEA